MKEASGREEAGKDRFFAAAKSNPKHFTEGVSEVGLRFNSQCSRLLCETIAAPHGGLRGAEYAKTVSIKETATNVSHCRNILNVDWLADLHNSQLWESSLAVSLYLSRFQGARNCLRGSP